MHIAQSCTTAITRNMSKAHKTRESL